MKSMVCLFFLIFFVQTMSAKCTKSFSLVQNNAEVYDKKTGLIWSRCTHGMSWKNGVGCVGEIELLTLKEARKIEQTNKKWRLPSIDELASLVDVACKDYPIDSTIFPDIDSDEGESMYWSRTTYLSNEEIKEMPSLFYTMDFIQGSVDAHTQGIAYRIRWVRNKK
ncbi:MAG: DUF1566 domain-containing protein [Campylobacterales bacterium]|nr:DUF1566 domain-containing protein [Campylobacterales bacterium]